MVGSISSYCYEAFIKRKYQGALLSYITKPWNVMELGSIIVARAGPRALTRAAVHYFFHIVGNLLQPPLATASPARNKGGCLGDG